MFSCSQLKLRQKTNVDAWLAVCLATQEPIGMYGFRPLSRYSGYAHGGGRQ